jgi:phosphocarrier protein HPr
MNEAGTSQDQRVYEADVTVRTSGGIHVRAAALLVQAASRFTSAELLISKDGYEVNGKSIMGVLTLVAEHDARLHLRARGDEAEELLKVMVAMLESNLDEVAE